MITVGEVEVIYTTFHVDVGETPFFVAIDYTKCKIVISIRGTLSMKDVLTDLNAEGEVLPLEPHRDDWLGHKGMVQAAVYIKEKLAEENLIQRALLHNAAKNTSSFGLVLVGHSLGAGTAAILAVLLKQEYPSLQCFSYSPPGGLLRCGRGFCRSNFFAANASILFYFVISYTVCRPLSTQKPL